MNSILEFINSLFKTKEETVLDDRFEFRLNKKEKILIKKYCDLKRISASEFFRNLAIKEINHFFNINAEEIDKINNIINSR
ncbi:DUF6290 family protein [Clostridium isatidis]|uniref:DUF6290 family protein n=1 Tax=Clostridium isatidis TaxID=182773 RepID=UPI003AAAA0C0